MTEYAIAAFISGLVVSGIYSRFLARERSRIRSLTLMYDVASGSAYAARESLKRIAAMNTPKANGTVRKMAREAEEGLEQSDT